MGEWIAIAGLAITLLGIFAGFVSKESKQELKIEGLQKELQKYEEKNDENIKELFNSRNETNLSIKDLTASIRMLVTTNEQSFGEIKKMLDEINMRQKGSHNGS